VGEGEAGEATGDQCQSVIGLGKGRVGHGLGTDWVWARSRAGLSTELGTSEHDTGEHSTSGLGTGGLCPNVTGTH
jgi:hypothetical protein